VGVLPLVAEDGVVDLPVPFEALVECDGVGVVVVLARALGQGQWYSRQAVTRDCIASRHGLYRCRWT